jgi:hypothetical protein
MKRKSKGKNQKSKIKNTALCVVPATRCGTSSFLIFDFCLLIFDLPFFSGAPDV